MRDLNLKEFYQKQVEWYKHEIEWETEQIAWETEQVKRSRKADRELVEYVWSKGPVEKIDMEIYGKNGKGYKGKDTKQHLAYRKKYYLRRKRYMKSLAEYQRKLEELI